jgi:putative tryptophan/tyrosine transport system substrate-binding protein
MKRREFIMLVGGALAPSTFAARAQQPTKLPIIGFLGPTAPAPGWIAAFLERLREHGWIDGKNLAIEYRWAEGRPERFAEFAADFIRLKVDVIVTGGTPVVLALKRATSEIPIVFSSAGDPVGTGLVESLARPGGNITGLSFMTADVAGKRLELLREIVPGLGRLALIANAGFPEALLEMREVQATATTLGVNTMPFEVRRPDDFPAAFEAIKGADALYVCGDPMMLGNRARISALALDARLPTVHSVREHVEARGLISYGTDFQELFRRTADFVDKILRGTKPAEIPVEQPTKFDLVVNLVTAKTLGLAMPPTLLARADRIIE